MEQSYDSSNWQFAPFVQLPSASEIDAKLKTALGEKYTGYIERYPYFCESLANKKVSADSLGITIENGMSKYQKNERKEIQSTVLTALAKDNPDALTFLQSGGYITTDTPAEKI